MAGALIALAGAAKYVPPENPDPTPSPPTANVTWNGASVVNVTGASGTTSGDNNFTTASTNASSFSRATSGSSTKLSVSGSGNGPYYVRWSSMAVGESQSITLSATAINDAGSDTDTDSVVIRRTA
jgi:hypothetical protein